MVLLKLDEKLKESDLVNKYLWEKHKFSLQWRRVRLGMVPTKEMARAYMVILRWADAVIYDSDQVTIIEAKLRPNAGAIGQLEHYKDLFQRTPEFEQYWNKKINMMLLTPVFDAEIAEFCTKKGILYELYPLEEEKKEHEI